MQSLSKSGDSIFQGLSPSPRPHQRQNKLSPGGMEANQKAVCSPDPFVVPPHCWITSDFPDGKIYVQIACWNLGLWGGVFSTVKKSNNDLKFLQPLRAHFNCSTEDTIISLTFRLLPDIKLSLKLKPFI